MSKDWPVYSSADEAAVDKWLDASQSREHALAEAKEAQARLDEASTRESKASTDLAYLVPVVGDVRIVTCRGRLLQLHRLGNLHDETARVIVTVLQVDVAGVDGAWIMRRPPS